MSEALEIRAFTDDDRAFVLSLVERFTSFELPAWRTREELNGGIRRDFEKIIAERPPTSFLFIATRGQERVAFLHLVKLPDFFTGGTNCHLADLAVAPATDGQGLGSALLEFAETWARAERCERLSLAVFPGNARARALYERQGYGVELLRMVKPL